MSTPFSTNSDPGRLPAEAEAWLRDHPDVAPAELEHAWRLAAYAEESDPAFEPDPGRFQAMQARVHAAVQTDAGPRPAVRRAPRLRLVRTVWQVAAVVILAVGGLALWLRPIVVEAPYAEHRTVVLPDGSQVELNSGSRLSYRRTFGWRARRVTLHGEAFFDVATGEKLFAVETFNSAVQVLGTRFNVRAWPDEELSETVVVLEEGTVRFAARWAADVPVLLEPGQLSRVPEDAAAPTPPQPVEVAQRLAWRSGGMVFVDQPIGAILNDVERRFNTRIETRPASIRTVRLALILDEVESAEEVLATIAGTRGYAYEAVDGGYVLVAP